MKISEGGKEQNQEKRWIKEMEGDYGKGKGEERRRRNVGEEWKSRRHQEGRDENQSSSERTRKTNKEEAE